MHKRAAKNQTKSDEVKATSPSFSCLCVTQSTQMSRSTHIIQSQHTRISSYHFLIMTHLGFQSIQHVLIPRSSVCHRGRSSSGWGSESWYRLLCHHSPGTSPQKSPEQRETHRVVIRCSLCTGCSSVVDMLSAVQC